MDGISDSDLVETTRVLLKLGNDNIRHLDTISNTLFGFMIIAIAAIWGFFFSQKFEDVNIWQFLINLGLTLALLGLWRWTDHEYDNQIASIYPEIVKYERILKINTNEGLSEILNRSSNFTEENKIKPDEPYDQLFVRIKNLVAARKIGERGKFRFTRYVFWFMVVSSLFCEIVLIANYRSIIDFLLMDGQKNIWMVVFGAPYLIAWYEMYKCIKIAQTDDKKCGFGYPILKGDDIK